MSKIGIMDSGVGGLTVTVALRRQLPQADLLYLGDTARNPYGSRSPAEIRGMARELAAWLLERGAEALVIACNTITFTALEDLRAFSPVPVYGMSPDCRLLPGEATLAVFATPATIATHCHRRAALRQHPAPRVIEVPCDGLAAAIERDDAAAVAACLLRYAPAAQQADAALWACTHYPLAAAQWRKLAPDCRWVDPGETTAAQVAAAVADTGTAQNEFYFTGNTLPRNLLGQLFGAHWQAANIII